MVEVCPGTEPELSTERTPSTVETTVEATGNLTTQKGALGGYGGKEGAVNAPWEHALRARNSCVLGRCKYANPDRRPDSYLGALGCDGYHATEHIDADDRLTVRWSLCPRHRAWWERERARLRAARPRPGPER